MNYIDHIAAEIKQAIPPSKRPEHDAQFLYRLYALLALTRGTETTLKNVHDAWSLWMIQRGIIHESLVPFEALRPEVQQEDAPYQSAVHSVATSLSR